MQVSTENKVTEPHARRTIFVGFRRAAFELWGEAGLTKIGELLPEEVRIATVDNVVIVGDWQPERYVMAWYEAVMNGPAQGSRAMFCTFIDRMMDVGVGTVQKLLLQLAVFSLVANRASKLWRHDHTHGTLDATKIADTTYLFILRDHPYTTTLLGRIAVAEICRYAGHLTRAKDVTAWHTLVGDELHVTVKHS